MLNLSIKHHRGIGLLELMLSIMVITALLLASTRYYVTARENMRVTQAVEIINNVASGSFKWLEGNPNFTGLTTTTLANYNLVPKSYANVDTNPWKGNISLVGNGDKLTITLTKLPAKSCDNLRNKIKNYFSISNDSDLTCAPALPATTFSITIPQNP